MERLLTLYSEVQSTDVRWLWYPFIAIGKITLLQGDPGDFNRKYRSCVQWNGLEKQAFGS